MSRLAITTYGFSIGPIHIQRLVDDPKWGTVVVIQTPKERVEIRSTPTGLLRIGPVMDPVNYGEDPIQVQA